jgi:hypothetical protein
MKPKVDRQAHQDKTFSNRNSNQKPSEMPQEVPDHDQMHMSAKSKFQENLRQSCKIYRHLEKIFSKLLENNAAMSKLQKAFTNIFNEELEYVRDIIQKISASNEPDALKESTINNLFIFKENLKIFISLFVENQYEDFVSKIRFDKMSFPSLITNNEKPSSAISHLKMKAMERIDEDDNEELAERSDRRSDKYGKVQHITLTSMYERASATGTLSTKIEQHSKKNIPTTGGTPFSEEKTRLSQPITSNKSLIHLSSAKQLNSFIGKSMMPGSQPGPRKSDKLTTKQSFKNLKDV